MTIHSTGGIMLNHLFQPYTIKGKTIKNRLVVPAMVANYCTPDGYATEQYIAYHETKAKGGWGLIITEDYAINPYAKGYVGVAGLWSDDQIPGHTELVKRVHAQGSTILAQIYHCGRQTNSRIIGRAPVAPSPIPCPMNQEMPHELTVDEIHELVEQFGDTALRAKKCGFDGVEIHGGHGYLIAEFLSPYTNKRADMYGGNLQNRMRFLMEVIANVREKCGDDFILGFRISGDEHIEGGRTIADTQTIAMAVEEAGIDLIHVSVGTYGSPDAPTVALYAKNHAWIVDFAEEVKKVVDIPVITVGRFNDPCLANMAIKAKKADFVAMGRGSLADPYLPKKAEEGRFDEIRQCIGCDQGCISRLNMQEKITCVLNPTLGREYELTEVAAETPKKVVVIGAGPAGLTAAAEAGKAGHDVVVLEKEHMAGGQFRLAAVPPFKGEIINFINWQLNECRKLNIPVRYNTEATVETVTAEHPDVVILAAGANPVTPPIPGIDLPNVVTAHDVLAGKTNVGFRNVVIGGGQVGAETAFHLAIQFKQVSIVEMLPEILGTDMMEKMVMTPYLMQRQIDVHTGTKVLEIAEDHVLVSDGTNEFAIPADTVVLAIGSRPNNALKDGLEAAGLSVKTVGDAQKVGNVMAATAMGFELGRSL